MSFTFKTQVWKTWVSLLLPHVILSSDPVFFFVQIWRPPSIQSDHSCSSSDCWRPPRLNLKTTQCSIKSFLFFVRSLKTTQRSIRSFLFFIRSFISVHPVFISVLRQIIPLFFFIRWFFLFFRSVVLQVPKSSFRDSVLLFWTRVYKTQDLPGIIFPTHQVKIKSLILEF